MFFKDSFRLLKEKFGLSVALFLTQLVYSGIFLVVFVMFFYKIMYHANFLLEALYSLTPEQITSGTVNNSLALYAHYSGFMDNLALLVLFSYLLYVLINGINWSISNMIVNKGKFSSYIPKYIITSLIFTIPLGFVLWEFLRAIAVTGNETALFYALAGVFLVFWYFMMICFSIMHRYKVKEILKLLSDGFKLGILKGYVLAPVYLLIAALLGGIVYLMWTYSDIRALLQLIIVVFVLAIVWTRILFMSAVKECEK